MSIRRHVYVHLTPYAPDVEGATIGDVARNISHWAKSPAFVLQELCNRLQVAAGQLVVRAAPGDPEELEILGPSKAAGAPPQACLALIGFGVTLAEAQAALAGLTQGRRAAA